MSIEEFLAHLAKTPASGFTWTINEDGCIRAEHSCVKAGKANFCPITAVIYQLQGVVMQSYEVWQPTPIGLSKAAIADITVASDIVREVQPCLSWLRLQLMRAVGLLKPFPNSRRPA